MVYGREGGLSIYELLGMAERGAETPGWVTLYESGLAAYRARNFVGARIFFQQLLAARASDQPARMMLQRCAEFLQSPPGKDWEGTSAMKAK
jgi:adenylate cyclase